jgi:hypothetical protein
MQSPYQRWFKLFLFCAGTAIASSFILQWLANDFTMDGKRFSILDLELFYPKFQLTTVLKKMDDTARIALNYHSIFDFVFMTGIYPGIAAFCMMTRERLGKKILREILFALAMLQPVAWAFDVTENVYLMNWVAAREPGDDLGVFHNIVAAKWLIGILGFLVALVLFVVRKRTRR